MSVATIEFRRDDLSGPEIAALITFHQKQMFEYSPPDTCHVMGVDALRGAGVRVYSGWVDGELAVVGALKRLDAENVEIKSMRAADAFRGKGAGRAMLDHLLAEARADGYRTVWLETGTPAPFKPAERLYRQAGFTDCGSFAGYPATPWNMFMNMALDR